LLAKQHSERNGVVFIKVIKAIKKRPKESNIIFLGPGIGGTVYPKTAGWATEPTGTSSASNMATASSR
jgi:hypothetical protein